MVATPEGLIARLLRRVQRTTKSNLPDSPAAQVDRDSAVDSLIEASQAWSETRSSTDLERTIAAARTLIALLPTDDTDRAVIVGDLTKALSVKYAAEPTETVWSSMESEVVSYSEQIPPGWLTALYTLAHGRLLYERALIDETASSIEAAIAMLENARNETYEQTGAHGTVSLYLGQLRSRLGILGDDENGLAQAADDLDAVVTNEKARPIERRDAIAALAEVRFAQYITLSLPDELASAQKLAEDLLATNPRPDVAMAMTSLLGRVWRSRYNLNADISDLKRSIAYYKEVVDAGNPREVALASDGLANSYSDLFERTNEIEDLDRSIDFSMAALQPNIVGQSRKQILVNLADSYLTRGRLVHSLDDLEHAENLAREALTMPGKADGVEFRGRDRLAEVLLVKDAFEHSAVRRAEALQILRDGVHELLDGQWSLAMRRRLVRRDQARILRRLAVGTLLKGVEEGSSVTELNLQEAFMLGEAAKAPQLTHEALFRLISAPSDIPGHMVESEQLLLARLSVLDADEISASIPVAFKLSQMRARTKAREAIASLWTDMESISPTASEYVHRRRDVYRGMMEGMKERRDGTALLSLQDATEIEDNGSRTDFLCLLVVIDGGKSYRLVGRVERRHIDGAEDDLHNLLLSRDRWRANEFFAPISSAFSQEFIPPHDVLAFSPTETTYNLPWSYILENSGWRTSAGRAPAISMVPSHALTLLGGVRPRSTMVESLSPAVYPLVDILDPPAYPLQGMTSASRIDVDSTRLATVIGNPSHDLPSAADEAEAVARFLNVEPLIGSDATIEAAAEALAASTAVHLAAHAKFDPVHPMESRIKLADGELRAAVLTARWLSARLIVLSGCESGTGGNVGGGEMFGFIHVLMSSGVEAVVASLWPVDDAATAYFMRSFYRGLKDGSGPAVALSMASDSVRAQPGWDSPYYWAPFIVSQRGDPDLKGIIESGSAD